MVDTADTAGVTVITFDDSVHRQFAMRSISQADQYIQREGGGTRFTPALQYAQTLLADAAARPYAPVLILCRTERVKL